MKPLARVTLAGPPLFCAFINAVITTVADSGWACSINTLLAIRETGIPGPAVT